MVCILHGLVDNFRCASVCGCDKTSFVVKSIVTTFESLELILFLDDQFNNHMHFSFYPNSALICNSAYFWSGIRCFFILILHHNILRCVCICFDLNLQIQSIRSLLRSWTSWTLVVNVWKMLGREGRELVVKFAEVLWKPRGVKIQKSHNWSGSKVLNRDSDWATHYVRGEVLGPFQTVC